MAGNQFSLDREFLARELGFSSVAENSLWGVSDRDFIVEFMMWASLVMMHMSKMAEDLILYSTAEFGFVTLSDAYRYDFFFWLCSLILDAECFFLFQMFLFGLALGLV